MTPATSTRTIPATGLVEIVQTRATGLVGVVQAGAGVGVLITTTV